MSSIGFDLFTVVSGLSIITMLIALLRVLNLKKNVPSGGVSKIWNVMAALVIFLFIVYLTLPFFLLLPQETKDLIVSFIFFFGAIYVLLNLELVSSIITMMKKQS
ncbi:MAG TPA: hypothetical protein VIX18_03645 [Nitrospirota bacterium]